MARYNLGVPGVRPLEDFDGATDDEKLTAALSYAAAQTYPPTIAFGNRTYNLSTQRTLYQGFRIQGPPGYSNAERGDSSNVHRVVLTTGAPWLVTPSGVTVFDVSISQMSFKANSTTSLIGSVGGGGLYCALIRDVTFTLFRSVLGTAATKLLITACNFDGYWESNGCYECHFNLGGSDNTLWPAGGLVDSSVAFYSAGPNVGPGNAHVRFDYLEKTTVGPLYITAESGWRAIEVNGAAFNTTAGNLGGPLMFTGLRIEGRNAAAPGFGSMARVNGGGAVFRDCWFSYGMSSPSTMGENPADAGIIHQAGGQLLVDGCSYDRATGVAETVPFVHSAAGWAKVGNVLLGSKVSTWTGRPRVQNAGGTITTDSTVTLV